MKSRLLHTDTTVFRSHRKTSRRLGWLHALLPCPWALFCLRSLLSVCPSKLHIALPSSCSPPSATEAAMVTLGRMYLRTYWIHGACGKDTGVPPTGCSVLFTSRPLPLLCLLSVETSCILSDKVLLIFRSHLKPHFFQEASSEPSPSLPRILPDAVSHIHHSVSNCLCTDRHLQSTSVLPNTWLRQWLDKCRQNVKRGNILIFKMSCPSH